MIGDRTGKFAFFLVAGLSLAVIALSAITNGPILAPDSATYTRWSDDLIAHKFNILAYLQSADFVVPPYMYMTTVVTVAALRLAFAAYWQQAFILVNLASCVIIFACFLRLAKQVSLAPIWLAAAAVCFALLDGLHWPNYVLADTYYAALTMLIITALLEGKTRWTVFAIFLLALASFTRPTSPALIIAVILSYGGVSLRLPERGPLVIASVAALLIALSSLVFALVITSPGLGGSSLELFRAMAEAGQVIHDRPDTWLAEPKTYFDFAVLFLTRFAYFFAPWVATWSLAHNSANMLVMSVFLIAVFLYFLPSKGATPMLAKLQFCLLVFIVVGALFHAGTLIDFDWRYRFAYSAPMALFAAAVFAQRLSSRLRQHPSMPKNPQS